MIIARRSCPRWSTDIQGEQPLGVVRAFVEAFEIVARRFYEHLGATARRRVPRDPADWPPIALALALDLGILTGDHDFLGCGCPTWTVKTLLAELGTR